MGYVMRIFSNHWFKRLVVVFAFLSASPFSYSQALWSSVGYWYFRSDLNSDGDKFVTQCDLSKFPGKKLTDGDLGAPRIDSRVKFDGTGIVTDYGDGDNSFVGDGWFRYAEKIEFSDKLSKGQSQQGRAALKNALKNGNCDIADSLLNAMNEPFINDDGIWAFSNGEDACAVLADGSSSCDVEGAAEECDKNGQNCRIIIGNDKEMTLEEYSKVKPKDQNLENSQHGGNQTSKNENNVPDIGKGLSGNNSGHSNNSASSNSQSSQSSETSQGSKGNKKGAVGNGKGKGEGEGDGEGNGKFNKPSLEQFDLKSAFAGLKDKLKDLIPDLSMPSGSCPTVSIPVFNTTKNIDVHCRIFDQNGSKLTAVFSFIWGFIAIRILLSA